MPLRMLQFTRIEQRFPEKRAPESRTQDFKEIYADFDPGSADAQASRCGQCGIPFCSLRCPLGNNIPDWLMLIAAGRMKEAYRVASAVNAMPEICGRICPQDRLCEKSCVLERSEHQAVAIGFLEKHVAETAWANGWIETVRPTRESPKSVGIVGSGPAGLAAAEGLRAQGIQVHIYDRSERFGGLLMYGIPSFKLEKSVVERRIRRLADSGVVFHAKTEIAGSESFSNLRRQHDAVLIAAGAAKAQRLDLPGADLSGVHQALDYLIASNRADFNDSAARAFDPLNARGKTVAVIGGGDTAMDCVRTALRQDAKSVVCLYRRDRANMPGSRREALNAEEEGGRFAWLSTPEALIEGNVPGRVAAVRIARMSLGLPDVNGRQTPQQIEGSSHSLAADMVIAAVGFVPEDLPRLFGEDGLELSPQGTLDIDPKTHMTSLPGIFAAGDAVRGPSLAVWAIRDGRDAAASIVRFLEHKRNAA